MGSLSQSHEKKRVADSTKREMFRPRTQSAPGYGRKAISTAPAVSGLEDVLANEDPIKERVLPLGSYSVRPSVAYYKEELKRVNVKSEAVEFPRKTLSLAQAWVNADDENRKVSAALRKASPLVPELVLFKQIYGPKLPSLSDNVAMAGDAITAAALAYINRNTGPQTPVVIPGTQPGTNPSDSPGGPPGGSPGGAPSSQPGTTGGTPASQPGTTGGAPASQPGGTPFIPPATLPTSGNVPVPPASVPTGTGVVPAGQPTSQANQIVSVIGAGNAVMAYFQNNSGTVGPVEILNPGATPSTIETLTQFIGPVTLSNRGDEQFFIVPPSNVDPGEASAWFGPPSTSFQGGLAMPGSVALDSPITAVVLGGAQRQTITIGPALGVNTAIQIKLPDEPIQTKQRLDTLDAAYGHQSTALVVYTPKSPFSTYQDLAASIAPAVVSSQAPPSYPLFLTNLINQVVYDGLQSVAPWGLIDGPGLKMQGDVNPVYDWLYSTASKSVEIKTTKLYTLVQVRCRAYGFLPTVPRYVCDWIYAETAYSQLVKYQRAVFPDVTNAGNLPNLNFTLDPVSANASVDDAFAALESLGVGIVAGAFATMEKQADGSASPPVMSDAVMNAAARDTSLLSAPPQDPADVNTKLMNNTLRELFEYGQMYYSRDGVGGQLLDKVQKIGVAFFRMPGTQSIRAALYDRRFSFALRTGLIFSGVAAYSVSLSLFYGFSNMAALGVCIGLLANVMGRLAATGRMQRPGGQDLRAPDMQLVNIAEEVIPDMVVRDGIVQALVVEENQAPDNQVQGARFTPLQLANFRLYADGIEGIRLGRMNISTNRVLMRDHFRHVLQAFGISDAEINGVLSTMTGSSGGFQFWSQIKRAPNSGMSMVSPHLYECLHRNEDTIHKFIDDYLEGAAIGGGDTPEFRLQEARNFVSRMNLKGMPAGLKQSWAYTIAIMYGIANPDTIVTMVNSLPDPPPLDGEGDDALGPNSTATGSKIPSTGAPGMFDKPAAAPAPPARVDGSATMTPVATPQFTDAPATVTLENAMSQLADRTLSVQQVTRSGLPDSYSWYLMKARRRTLRALWFAVFTGLGATPSDATQVLNFMDPTFVNVSLNTQEYSGLRIQGRHGAYPRLDEFFLKYFTPISKYFAGLSSAIRVSYASTLATRIFGLRGKSYFTKMLALTPTELAQVAKNSREVLDIVVGDTTYSDSTPQGPAPTTEEARGYGTGPYDYVGP